MKPQLFAVISKIIKRSTHNGYLKGEKTYDLMNKLQKGNVESVWNEIESELLESIPDEIWNSCVVNAIPYFWIRNDVIPFPLQMLAYECEYLDSDLHNVMGTQKYIENKASGTVDQGTSSPLYLFRFANWEDGDWLKLLQRINLNQREQPFIDKWKWSKKQGLAYLSNDGRISVQLKLAVIRAFHYWMSVSQVDSNDVREKWYAVLNALTNLNNGEQFSLDSIFSQDELIFLLPITILYRCKVS